MHTSLKILFQASNIFTSSSSCLSLNFCFLISFIVFTFTILLWTKRANMFFFSHRNCAQLHTIISAQQLHMHWCTLLSNCTPSLVQIHNCTPSLVHNYCTCIGAPYIVSYKVTDDCAGLLHQATKKTIHKQTSKRRRKKTCCFSSQEPHTVHTITGALVHLTK